MTSIGKPETLLRGTALYATAPPLQEPKALHKVLNEVQQKALTTSPSKTVSSPITASLAQIVVSELYKGHQNVSLPLRPHLSHPSMHTKVAQTAAKELYRPLALAPKQPTVRRPKRVLPVVSNRTQYRGVVFKAVGVLMLLLNLRAFSIHSSTYLLHIHLLLSCMPLCRSSQRCTEICCAGNWPSNRGWCAM